MEIQAQNCTYLNALVPISSDIFPSPLSFFSLFMFSLYLDPPFLLLLNLLIPLPAFSLSPAICFPASSPMRAEGSSGSGTGEAPRMHKWCLGFPFLYFPGNLLALSHGWEQMGFLQMLQVVGWLPCSTNTGPESNCPGILRKVLIS